MLATVQDIETAIRGPLTEGEQELAVYYLEQASAMFTALAAQKFLPAESRVRLLPTNGAVRLSQLPVVEVVSVQDLDGNPVDFTFDGVRSLFDLGDQPVVVEYEHGSDDVPADVVRAVTRIAIRGMAKRGLRMGKDEKAAAMRYRRLSFPEEI